MNEAIPTVTIAASAASAASEAIPASEDVEIVDRLLGQYAIEPPWSVRPLGQGSKSRAYLVERAGEPGRVLKLYGESSATRRDIEEEVALLRQLERRGLPVALPIPRRDRDPICDVPAGLGARYAVLFTHARGEVVERLHKDQARAVGAALAALHRDAPAVAPGWPGSREKRLYSSLGLGDAVDRLTAAVAAGWGEQAAESGLSVNVPELLAEAQAVEAALAELRPGLRWGVCHGAFHFGNFALAGDAVTLFDFEAHCHGYQVIDLARILASIAEDAYRSARQPEARAERGRSGRALVAGYQDVRPLTPQELSVLLLFVPVLLLGRLAELLGVDGGPDTADLAAAGKAATYLAAWRELCPALGWSNLAEGHHAGKPA